MFEANFASKELRREGRLVPIQDLPLRLLQVLIQSAGQIVTREEMQRKLWDQDTFVDFDAGLKTALKKVRQALGDDAANPRFIETVPRQGYRFIAPVLSVEAVSPVPAASLVAPAPLAEQRLGVESASPEGAATVEPPAKPEGKSKTLRRKSVAAMWTAAAILLVASFFVWERQRPKPPVLDRIHPFLAAHGEQFSPALSPNGETLAYIWRAPRDRHANVYVQRLDASTPLRFTADDAEIWHPVWSPDGRQVAFLRDLGGDSLSVIVSPLVGVGERRLADIRKGASPWFDWSPDGKWLTAAEPSGPEGNRCVELISIATGERHFITASPEGWRGDSLPAFSPDSSYVVFRRTTKVSGVEDLYRVSVRGGEVKRLTSDDRMIPQYAFTPDGGLLFSSKRDGAIASLWWLPPGGGTPTRITAATVNAISPTVSRNGQHFAFTGSLLDTNIWQVPTDGQGEAIELINSELPDSNAQFSPDGEKIAFESTRTGSSELWVSHKDGSHALKISDARGTPIGNPRWSPDGREIVFEWVPRTHSQVWVMAADGGQQRPLAADSYENHTPVWSADGRFIFFASARAQGSEIWRLDARRTAPAERLNIAGSAPAVSPDGKYLYWYAQTEIRRVPLSDDRPAGAEERVVDGLEEFDWGNWAPANDGVYYVRRTKAGNSVEFREFRKSSVRVVFALRKPPLWGSVGLSLAPDGKSLLLAQVDQHANDIYLQ